MDRMIRMIYLFHDTNWPCSDSLGDSYSLTYVRLSNHLDTTLFSSLQSSYFILNTKSVHCIGILSSQTSYLAPSSLPCILLRYYKSNYKYHSYMGCQHFEKLTANLQLPSNRIEIHKSPSLQCWLLDLNRLNFIFSLASVILSYCRKYQDN